MTALVKLWLLLLVLAAARAPAAPVKVLHREGLAHGYLSLDSRDGRPLGEGEFLQTLEDERVTARLVLRFRDGSHHEETAVYTQEGTFRLLQHRLVQNGPAFDRAIDARLDVQKGTFVARYREPGKTERTIEEHIEVPPDLVNGIVLTVVKNIPPRAQRTTVSMLAATPKPRIVRLHIEPDGAETFRIEGEERRAVRYVLKADLGGLTGVLAGILGKTPPDSHVWIDPPPLPAFVRSESPFFAGGPLWRLGLARPARRDDPD